MNQLPNVERRPPCCLRWCAWWLAVLWLSWVSSVAAGDIHTFAEEGNAAKVQELLQGQPDLVNSLDAQKETPLHRAARKGHKAVVQVLLEHQANVNALNANKVTPLKLAKGFGHQEVSELLSRSGGVEKAAASRPASKAVETPEERERRLEQALGIKTVAEGEEWSSSQENCAMQLPAGWKRMPAASTGAILALTDSKEGRMLSVIVQPVSPRDRLDERFLDGLQQGILEKNSGGKVAKVPSCLGGLRAYEVRTEINKEGATPGTLAMRVLIADGRCYALAAGAKSADPMADPVIKRCVDSFHFLQPPKLPGFFAGLNSYRLGYLVGFGLAALLFIAGAVSLIRRLTRRRTM